MAEEIIQQTAQWGEIILYQPDETVRLEVRLEDDTVWLNRLQLAELFGRDVKTIGKHVNNALQEYIDRHNAQYAPIAVEHFNRAHNRFLLIDDEVYHIGA